MCCLDLEDPMEGTMTHTVLVVEDDPTVRMLLEDMLADQGHAVISARSGGEALNILGEPFSRPDVLVADIRIGSGIDGWEIARCAREIVPGLPVVYVTADSAGQFDAQGVQGARLLRKPFTAEQLTGAVAALI
jgi:CheY-like chemotaxis protein